MPATLLAALAGALAGVALVDAAVALVAARGGDVGSGGAGPRGRRPGRRAGPAASARPGGPPVPSALAALLVRAGRRAGAPRVAADLAARLEAAGRPGGLAVEDVAALKGGAALAAGARRRVAGAAPARPPRAPRCSSRCPRPGSWRPDLWLRRLTAARGQAMAAELPDVLDLLRVAVEAGLPPRGRWPRSGDAGRARWPASCGPRRRARRPASRATEALALLQARCPTPGVAPLVAALGRAERHGAPLGPALAALAADARASETQRVRDRAARAAPRIQLAVALLLVPAVMLLVAAALVAGLT